MNKQLLLTLMKIEKLSSLLKTSLDKKEFANAIGVSLVAVYNYINGKRIPEPEIMNRITKFTNGYIQPNDFYNINNCQTN